MKNLAFPQAFYSTKRLLESMKLPIQYNKLKPEEKRLAREEYIKLQNGKCYFCKGDITKEAPRKITKKVIDWRLFPKNFLQYPVHLQHNHDTGLTEGAVHNYCNAVMWQYHGR